MRSICLFVIMALCAASADAQSTLPAGPADVPPEINALRNDLIDSFNKGDLPRLLSHLDDNAVVTWQNAEVCHGPEDVKRYYDKMMTGPDRRVRSASAEPKVTGRQIYGDWAVTWGEMNDHFVLTDGTEISPASRFTATTVKRGDVWKVAAFHVSTNAFDNPILSYGLRRTAWTVGAVAAAVGLLVGAAAGWALRKPKRS